MDHIHCHSYNDGCSVHTQSDFYNIANSNICDILSKSWNQNLTNNTDPSYYYDVNVAFYINGDSTLLKRKRYTVM